MRNGFLNCAAVVLVGAGLALVLPPLVCGAEPDEPMTLPGLPPVVPLNPNAPVLHPKDAAPAPDEGGKVDPEVKPASLTVSHPPVEAPPDSAEEAAAAASAGMMLPGLNAYVPLNPNAPVLHPETEQADQPHEPILARCPIYNRGWASAEYLLWRFKQSDVPALVTTGPATAAHPGALNDPTTTVLFGAGGIPSEDRSGGRFTVGYWICQDHSYGIDGNYLFLATRANGFELGSPGAPVLARPFFDVRANRPDASLLAFPGVSSGSVVTRIASRLWGSEGNFRQNVFSHGWYDLSTFIGFRYLQLDEGLEVLGQSSGLPATGAFGASTVESLDSVGVRNSFYGGQLGFDGGFQVWRLSIDVVGKLALGTTDEVARLTGLTVSQGLPTGPRTSIPTGLLVQPSNSGRFTQDEFTVIPEINVNVGLAINNHLRAMAGYTALYWDHVFRPGDQVDPNVNTTQIPGPAGGVGLIGLPRPTFPSRQTDFWAHGFNVGLEVRY